MKAMEKGCGDARDIKGNARYTNRVFPASISAPGHGSNRRVFGAFRKSSLHVEVPL